MFNETLTVELSASCRGLIHVQRNSTTELSASCVDSLGRDPHAKARGGPRWPLAPPPAIPRRSPRFAWGPSPGGSPRPPLRATKFQSPSCRPHAATRNSPSIPTLRVGPLAKEARASASFTGDEISIAELSASCRDSQFPVDPHASRGAPRREARAATPLRACDVWRTRWRAVAADSVARVRSAKGTWSTRRAPLSSP